MQQRAQRAYPWAQPSVPRTSLAGGNLDAPKLAPPRQRQGPRFPGRRSEDFSGEELRLDRELPLQALTRLGLSIEWPPRSSYASRSYWGAEIRPPGPQAPAGYRAWPRPSLSLSLPSWRGLRCTSFRRWRARLPPTELVGPLGGRTGWPCCGALPLWCRSGAASDPSSAVCAPKDRAAEHGPLIEDALGTWHPSSGLALLLRQTRHGQSTRVDRFLRALLPRCSAVT